MVGYRYYDTVDTPLYYGFGHGLSYSRFVYKYMTVRPVTASAETGGTMDAPRYELAVTVKNDSLRAGKEVVQVYVAPKERQDDRPAHKLCAFEKMELMPGEEKTVTLTYAGQNVETVFSESTFVNDRQKAEVSVVKKDKDTLNLLDGGGVPGAGKHGVHAAVPQSGQAEASASMRKLGFWLSCTDTGYLRFRLLPQLRQLLLGAVSKEGTAVAK